MKGYVGEACPECANFTLVRNGTCLKCGTCGSTTGVREPNAHLAVCPSPTLLRFAGAGAGCARHVHAGIFDMSRNGDAATPTPTIGRRMTPVL